MVSHTSYPQGLVGTLELMPRCRSLVEHLLTCALAALSGKRRGLHILCCVSLSPLVRHCRSLLSHLAEHRYTLTGTGLLSITPL